MNLSRLGRVIGGLSIALFIPVICYFVLKSKGHTGHISLPKYFNIDTIVDKNVDGKIIKDTQYHIVNDLQLTNQINEKVSINEGIKNKIVILSFFFTNCKTICPKITSNVNELRKALKKIDISMQFVSISVDPENDSVKALRAYAEKLHVDHDKWWFCTGSKKDIYNYARVELELPLQDGNADAADFIHPSEIVILDKYRNIRGIYNGLDSAEIIRCANDIPKLMLEKNKYHEPKRRNPLTGE
jgi:protein SCO1/2